MVVQEKISIFYWAREISGVFLPRSNPLHHQFLHWWQGDKEESVICLLKAVGSAKARVERSALFHFWGKSIVLVISPVIIPS